MAVGIIIEVEKTGDVYKQRLDLKSALSRDGFIVEEHRRSIDKTSLPLFTASAGA